MTSSLKHSGHVGGGGKGMSGQQGAWYYNDVGVVHVNSLGFGGLKTILVIRKSGRELKPHM
jgi:hypothetical protein